MRRKGGEKEGRRVREIKQKRSGKKGSQLLESNQTGSYFPFYMTYKIKLHENTVFVCLSLYSESLELCWPRTGIQ